MFRDLLDEEGEVLTHNFRPIQPLGDRVILFNIIDDDDNTLDSQNIGDDIPLQIDHDTNDVDLTDELDKGDKNVLNDSPGNSLDDSEADDSKKKKIPDNGSMVHFVSLHVLSMTILASRVFGS